MDEGSTSKWFEANIEYEGNGYAEFSDGQIILEGITKVQFTESGESFIEMTFTNIVSSNIDYSHLLQFFNRNLNVKDGIKLIKFSKTLESCKCTKLEVTTSDGVFSNIDYKNIIHFMPNVLINKLKFYILLSQFKTNIGTAKYWAIPLCNFVSKFNKHPLQSPHPLSVNDADYRIVFRSYHGNIGIIEPLLDYESRKNKLIEGKIKNLITTLIIGVIETELDIDHLDNFYPINFLDLLGLATGTEVGTPWIEFRTTEGKLVQRIHCNLNNPYYTNGYITIDEFWNIGIGQLLTDSQYKNLGMSYTITIIKHLIEIGNKNQTMDEKFMHIVQALECLINTFSLDQKDLLKSLDINQKQGVEQILESAKNQILALYSTPESKIILGSIANRVLSANKKKEKFSSGLDGLINLFNLSDGEIMNEYYKKQSLHNSDWSGLINQCRNEVVHEGYLNLHKIGLNPKEASSLMKHLHDILLRIVFTMLCYNGTYESPIDNNHNSKQVDWVKNNSTYKDLGY